MKKDRLNEIKMLSNLKMFAETDYLNVISDILKEKYPETLKIYLNRIINESKITLKMLEESTK